MVGDALTNVPQTRAPSTVTGMLLSGSRDAEAVILAEDLSRGVAQLVLFC